MIMRRFRSVAQDFDPQYKILIANPWCGSNPTHIVLRRTLTRIKLYQRRILTHLLLVYYRGILTHLLLVYQRRILIHLLLVYYSVILTHLILVYYRRILTHLLLVYYRRIHVFTCKTVKLYSYENLFSFKLSLCYKKKIFRNILNSLIKFIIHIYQNIHL